MKLNKLKKHIRCLATLEETDNLVISCYMAVDSGQVKDSDFCEMQLSLINQSLSAGKRSSMSNALKPIREYLVNKLSLDTKGVAIFSRSGDKPFFLPLQLQHPLPNSIAVNSTPNIFHLIELKDYFHRYIVIITTRESSRILEVNVGSVTKEIWTQRPDLRKHIGQEFTKMHFQKHSRERGPKYIKEKIKIVKKLLSETGQTYLVLAGHPVFRKEIRDNLPKNLLLKLVSLIPDSDSTESSDVVKATIASFVRTEEEKSQYISELLFQEFQAGGLAVVGVRDCLKALKENRVDTLVLLKKHSLGKGWTCSHCEHSGFNDHIPSRCPACRAFDLKVFDIKEELVRLAEHIGAELEMLNQNDALNRLGGVGCLLRHRLPE